MLYGRGVEIAANALEQRFALFAIVAEHADLDQLVSEKIDVDLMQHRGREAVLAYRHDGVQRVRARAKGAPLGGC
jgi:RNA-binding protein YhbY